MVVRADPGLVTEVDRRPLGPGLGADRRELLVAPALDRLRVGLPGPPQRPLRRQPEGAQQPTHADRRQRHRELAADQLPDHVPGPQREPELQLPRIGPGDQRVEPAHLLPGQLRRSTRHRAGLQRVPAALPVLGQPPVDRAPAHAQRRRDIFGMHPRLDRVHRPQPHRLQGPVVQLPAIVLAHTALWQEKRSSQLTNVRVGKPRGSARSAVLWARGLPLAVLGARTQEAHVGGRTWSCRSTVQRPRRLDS